MEKITYHQPTTLPIATAMLTTSHAGARVFARDSGGDFYITLGAEETFEGQYFTAVDLRETAEFFNKLADNLSVPR